MLRTFRMLRSFALLRTFSMERGWAKDAGAPEPPVEGGGAPKIRGGRRRRY